MRQERGHNPELDPLLVENFKRLFAQRDDTYAYQLPDGSYRRAGKWEQDGTEPERYHLLPYPLTTALVEAHLRGTITLGAYMLAADGSTDKIAFDVDHFERLPALQSMAADFDDKGIPYLLERSRRGGHLWLFLPRMRGTDARRFGKQLRAEYELEDVELYPKQDSVTKKAPVGSLMRMPLGVHLAATPSPHRFPIVDVSFSPLADRVRSYLPIILATPSVPQAFIDEVLSRAPPRGVRSFPFPERTVSLPTTLRPSEKIKRYISTQDWIRQYVEINHAGRGYCPFHDDHKMSFSVKLDDDYWQCFACEIGGDLINFHTYWRNARGQSTEFGEVVKDMLKLVGL